LELSDKNDSFQNSSFDSLNQLSPRETLSNEEMNIRDFLINHEMLIGKGFEEAN